jgi:exodeoxyribonuclease V beta subunit
MADLLRLPLTGRVLLEASAGTGKTYALETMVVRLVALENIPLEEIVIVTFTEAATAELRFRIARRLRTCLNSLTGAAQDPLMELLGPAQETGIPVTRRIQRAIQTMDRATIATIHGFCARLLGQFGLVAGITLPSALEPDLSPVRHRAALDLWRTQFVPIPGLAGSALRHALPLKDVEALLALPALIFAPQIFPQPKDDTSALIQAATELSEALGTVQAHWETICHTVATCETQRSACFDGRHIKAGTLQRCLAAWEAYLAEPWNLKKSQGLEKLTLSFLNTRTKASAPRDIHMAPLGLLDTAWEKLQIFQRHVQEWVETTRAHIAGQTGALLDRACAQTGVFGYDSLLRLAAAAVDTPEVCRKAQAVWRVALVDEFQDTDPIQEHILSRIFHAPGHSLITIGDPKQSIYAFRGADIHVYLDAKCRADHTADLDTNYRSCPGLVEATNTIFSLHPTPFVCPDITFAPVRPRPAPWPQLDDPEEQAALVLWHLPVPENPLAKGEAEPRIAKAVAAEISRLLHAGVCVNGAPLSPGHIAVLVDTHAQAPIVARALAEATIPFVMEEKASVLDTPEARAILALLWAFLEPRKRRRIATALATPLVGESAATLKAMAEDSALLASWQERFAHGQALWHRYGVVSALEYIFKECDVRQRLLSWPHGIRTATNLEHLLELLQAEESRGVSSRRLCQYLAWGCSQPATEATTLRPAHVGDAVRILTVHKSKGLEFPIVFWPYPFRKAEANPPYLYQNNEGLVLDFREANAEAKERATTETLAETVRLAYVAMTRASHRLYTVWGRVRGAESSALAWILHGPQRAESLTEDQVRELLEGLRSSTIGVHELPTKDPLPWRPPALASQPISVPWTRSELDPWVIQSFTSLTRGDHTEQPGWDEVVDTAEDPETADPSIAHFPRGPVAGACIHALMEAVLHGEPPEDAAQWALDAHGMDPSWAPVLTQMVHWAFKADLGGFCLAEATTMVPEMRFLFPTAGLSSSELAALCRDLTGRDILLRERVQQGWVTGVLDAVVEVQGRYYVVDWKTHVLGPNPGDYTSKAMAHIMASSGYDLQATLYLAALDRLLAARLSLQDPLPLIGGAFFLFLRGIHPDYPGCGVLHIPPQPQPITKLRQRLCSISPTTSGIIAPTLD